MSAPPKTAVVMALALGLSCVQAPPASHPDSGVEIPDSWDTVSDQTVTEGPGGPAVEWWSDFDSEPLAAAVTQALGYNSDVVAATSRVRQAEAQARIAGADLEPQLSAGLAGARRKQNFVGFPIPGSEGGVLSTTSSSYGVSLDLSWEIDLWGRLGAQAREGLANYQASRADLAGIRLSIAGQTAKAWFAVAEADQQVRLAERTVISLDRSAQQVRERFERGVRPPLDVRLALAQSAGARAAVELRRRRLDATSRQLEVLLGRYPGRDLDFPDDLIGVPGAIPAGLPADLVARRPDLLSAERRAVAADQRLRQARASLYPRLSLTASGGTSSGELTDLVDGSFSVWGFAANLFAPLLQGGRLRAGVDLAAAGVDESLAVYVGTVLRAYSEVEIALAAEQLLTARLIALDEAARQSTAAESLAGERYRNGLEPYITVLEAQRRTFDAESALLAGRRELLDNRVDLYLALGGGFRSASVLDVQPATVTEAPSEISR